MTSELATLYGVVFAILLAIIGFFMRKIYNRLDSFRTKEDCEARIAACRELNSQSVAVTKEIGEDREKRIDKSFKNADDKIEHLIKKFDDLRDSIIKFTKGEIL